MSNLFNISLKSRQALVAYDLLTCSLRLYFVQITILSCSLVSHQSLVITQSKLMDKLEKNF